ncbi:MAG: squalene/phytoene synthase family protein, partial [Rhodobiaceae bacterium]|nr:squalene/phytoene synthase family protein [Rhodobiaceae bacterium]
MTIDHFQYCLDQLRRFDHDRYLAILLTPEDVRAPLCALYAFESEMARIPHSVSEPMLGEIRYQWWRETFQKMTPGEEPSHEIVGAVSETFMGSGVDPAALIPLIDSRALELTEDPFDTFDALVAHVGHVAILGADLAFQLAGQKARHETLKEEIGKIVTGYGIISHVRRLPIDASRLRLGLPLDLMGKYEIDPHDVF